MKKTSLFFFLILTVSSNTCLSKPLSDSQVGRSQIESRIRLLEYFISIRDGIIPTASKEILEKSKTQRREAFISMTNLSQSIVDYMNYKVERDEDLKSSFQMCGRFVSNFIQLSRDFERHLVELQKTEKEYTQALLRGRLEVERSYLQVLGALVQKGNEAGYFDEYTPIECSHPGRDRWAKSVEKYVKSVIQYMNFKFGVEPVISRDGIDKMNAVVEKKSRSDRNKLIGSIVTETAISLLIWNYGILKGAVWMGKVFHLSKATVRGMQVVGSVAEVMASYYINAHYVFPEMMDFGVEETLSQWNDTQAELERFMKLNLNSPEEYVTYLLMGEKAVHELAIYVLETKYDDLRIAQEKWGSIDEALKYHIDLKEGLKELGK